MLTQPFTTIISPNCYPLNLSLFNTPPPIPYTFTRNSPASQDPPNPLSLLAPTNEPRFSPLGYLSELSSSNLCPRSDLVGWSLPSTTSSKTFRGLPFQIIAKTSTATSNGSSCATGTGVPGTTVTARIALLANNSNKASFGIYHGDWGLPADASARILEGPGSLAQSTGALYSVTNLSPDIPTVLEVTKIERNTTTRSLILYPDTPASSTLGAAVEATYASLELRSYATSYIPNSLTTPHVPRAADNLSIPTDPWFNPSEGTFEVEYTPTWVLPDASNGLLGFNSSVSKRLMYFTAGSSLVQAYDGTNVTVASTSSVGTAILGYNATNIFIKSGSAVKVGPRGTLFDDVTTLNIGCIGTTNALGGYVKRVRYMPRWG